jgi:hypothetical protein
MRGLSPSTPYCNTGVMVMNLKRWRTEEIARGALEYIRKFPQCVRYPDQDGLNAVLAGAWGLLDPKWNVMLAGINTYGQFFGMSKVEMQHAQEELLQSLSFTFTGPSNLGVLHQGTRAIRFHYLKQSKWFGGFEDINVLMEYTWNEFNEPDEWMNMLAMAGGLAPVIPRGDSFILVDESRSYGVVEVGPPFPF